MKGGKWSAKDIDADRITPSSPFRQSDSRNESLAKEEGAGLLRRRVVITYTEYRTRLRDVDNCWSKYCTDSIISSGYLPDDAPEFVEEIRHKQVKVKTRKKERTVITIEGVEDEG